MTKTKQAWRFNSQTVFATVGWLAFLCTCFVCAAPASAQRTPTWLPIDPKLPTLWIIGDSTVRNGSLGDGNNGQWGWGKPMEYYFDKAKVNVQNRAWGGTSSKSFQSTANMWPQILKEMKKGDFVIMQFGHNDGAGGGRGSLRGNGEETQGMGMDIQHSYGWYLRKYVSDAKEKGAAMSIICSLIPRNNWTSGKIRRDTTYAVWAEEAAKQAEVPFLPLNKIIADKYDLLGQQKVTNELFPMNEGTHTDWAGAIVNCECVIEGIKAIPDCELVKFLLPEPPKDLKNPTGKAR